MSIRVTRHHITLVRIVIIKKYELTSVDQDWKKGNLNILLEAIESVLPSVENN